MSWLYCSIISYWLSGLFVFDRLRCCGPFCDRNHPCLSPFCNWCFIRKPLTNISFFLVAMDWKWTGNRVYRYVRNLCAVWSYGRCTALVSHEHTLVTRLKRFTQSSSDWRAWYGKDKRVGRRGRGSMITTHLGRMVSNARVTMVTYIR